MSVERKGLIRDEGGATAVEFAIVGPVFLTLLFALFHFGWAMHCASSVRYAAEESARALVLNADVDPASIKANIVAKLTDIADPRVEVTVTKDRATTPGLQVAEVVTDYRHEIKTPFLPTWTVNFHNEVSVATPLLS